MSCQNYVLIQYVITSVKSVKFVDLPRHVRVYHVLSLLINNKYDRRKFTSDNMDRWKAEMGRVREEKRRRKKLKKRKSQKKEDPGARKGRKVAKHCVFPMICGSGGSQSRLAKAAGAEPAGQVRDEKLHAVVARSTFASEKAKKHVTFGALLGIEMSKMCTPLWREAHFQVRMHKTPQLRCRKSARRCGAKHISKSKAQKTEGFGALLDVQMSFCVAGTRDCAPCQKWEKREGFVAVSKTMAGVGHLKMHCPWRAQYKRHVHQSC